MNIYNYIKHNKNNCILGTFYTTYNKKEISEYVYKSFLNCYNNNYKPYVYLQKHKDNIILIPKPDKCCACLDTFENTDENITIIFNIIDTPTGKILSDILDNNKIQNITIKYHILTNQIDVHELLGFTVYPE